MSAETRISIRAAPCMQSLVNSPILKISQRLMYIILVLGAWCCGSSMLNGTIFSATDPKALGALCALEHAGSLRPLSAFVLPSA